ncbi:MAG TPA: hypothetical protein VLE89_03160, partial [Chlamydiales bacterium]|nr:hypothetical protein [Chlamydiales bacterium]
MKQFNEINYLYFSFLLIFLSFLSLSHFLWIERPLFGIPLFFLLYALGQGLLEICVFILIAWVLKRWAPKWLFWLFISFSFILQLVHFTDFTLVRLMDVSILYMFKFFLGSGIEHLQAACQALNMNRTMVFLIFFTIFSIPLAGLLFYWFTSKVAHRKPLKISLSQIIIAITSIGSALFLLDLFAHPFLNRMNYSKYQKVLPFGKTFIPPTTHCVPLEKSIAPPRDEQKALASLPNYKAT